MEKLLQYYQIPRTSDMPKTPCFPGSHSAAMTAPNAKPLRLNAVCFISISSTCDVYLTECVPGTSSVRIEKIPSSSLCVSSAFQALKPELAIMPSAKEMAVPRAHPFYVHDESLPAAVCIRGTLASTLPAFH